MAGITSWAFSAQFFRSVMLLLGGMLHEPVPVQWVLMQSTSKSALACKQAMLGANRLRSHCTKMLADLALATGCHLSSGIAMQAARCAINWAGLHSHLLEGRGGRVEVGIAPDVAVLGNDDPHGLPRGAGWGRLRNMP